jgi:hypothetical protein
MRESVKNEILFASRHPLRFSRNEFNLPICSLTHVTITTDAKSHELCAINHGVIEAMKKKKIIKTRDEKILETLQRFLFQKVIDYTMKPFRESHGALMRKAFPVFALIRRCVTSV